MSTAVLTKRIAEASLRLKARIGGIFYLTCGMAYSFVDGSVRGKLVVVGDATATAHNILAHKLLVSLGFRSRTHLGRVLHDCDAAAL